MTQKLGDIFTHNEDNGPPTHPLGLRDIILREISLHGPNCDLNHLDISQMTSLDDVFARIDFNGDISQWDTSRITSMRGTFSGSTFNGDISKWDTASTVRMASMFSQSVFNGNISQWDTANVAGMASMFADSCFEGDLSAWNVSRVIDTERMFENSKFNGDISKWDVSAVQLATSMFAGSPFSGDISSWKMREATQFQGMFLNSAFAGDLSKWTVPTWAMLSAVFSPDFAGVLPLMQGTGSEYYDYARMMGDAIHLDGYLKRMPLNAVHANLLLHHTGRDCPHYLTEDDFYWMLKQKSVLDSIGCSIEDARELLMVAIRERHTVTMDLPPNLLSGMELA